MKNSLLKKYVVSESKKYGLYCVERNHLRNPFIDGNIKKVIKPLEKVLKGFDTSKM